MDHKTIEEIIGYGESKDVEFKVTKPTDNMNYLKTVVAFSNGEGGIIVFGVEDKTKDIVGIPEDSLFPMMDSIINSISDGITPQIAPDISPLTVKEKNVIILRIPSGGSRPYYIKSLGLEHGVYARIGSTTREADGIFKKELYFENLDRSFDRELHSKEPVSEKDISKLCDLMYQEAEKNAKNEMIANTVKPVTVRQLLSWGVVRMSEGKILPNNAYAILAGEDEGLPTKIKCACFKGKNQVDFLDANEFDGFIGWRIDEAFKFVLRNIHKGIGFHGLHHYDDYEVPTSSIREAIINAIAHRSYIPYDDTKIAVFDDRIEINSPGKMPFGQTIEEMRRGHSMIRNKALAPAFAYMNLIEEWGSGVPRMFEECKEYGLKEPLLRDLGVSFKLTIYRPENYSAKIETKNKGEESGTKSGSLIGSTDSQSEVPIGSIGSTDKQSEVPIAGKKSKPNDINLSKSEKEIISYMESNQEYSSSLLAERAHLSERRIRALLSRLVEKGIVEKNGNYRYTKYKLAGDKK